MDVKDMQGRLQAMIGELQSMCHALGGKEEEKEPIEDDGSGELEGGEPKMHKAPAAIILALKKGMREE